MERIAIKHPEWLDINANGKISHGYDQEWFTDEWQRLSGCGPTTATQVVTYTMLRDGLLDVSQSADQVGLRAHEYDVELRKTKIWRWRI